MKASWGAVHRYQAEATGERWSWNGSPGSIVIEGWSLVVVTVVALPRSTALAKVSLVPGMSPERLRVNERAEYLAARQHAEQLSCLVGREVEVIHQQDGRALSRKPLQGPHETGAQRVERELVLRRGSQQEELVERGRQAAEILQVATAAACAELVAKRGGDALPAERDAALDALEDYIDYFNIATDRALAGNQALESLLRGPIPHTSSPPTP